MTFRHSGKIFLRIGNNAMIAREKILDVLKERLSILAGDFAPEKITNGMIVICEWGLDSEHGVELACDLSEQLSIEIPLNENPLIEDNLNTGEKRARTFGEVVNYLEMRSDS